MPYDPALAVQYARQNWDNVCTDGYIAGRFGPALRRTRQDSQHFLRVPVGTRFNRQTDGRETVTYVPQGMTRSVTVDFGPMDDCAHFISCCIGSPPGGTGGGLRVARDFNGPYGTLGAGRLLRHLVESGAGTVVQRERLPHASAQRHAATLQPGDLIFYAKPNNYGHSAIYLGNGNIACHTAGRADAAGGWTSLNNDDSENDWDIGAALGWTYTFLRMA